MIECDRRGTLSFFLGFCRHARKINASKTIRIFPVLAGPQSPLEKRKTANKTRKSRKKNKVPKIKEKMVRFASSIPYFHVVYRASVADKPPLAQGRIAPQGSRMLSEGEEVSYAPSSENNVENHHHALSKIIAPQKYHNWECKKLTRSGLNGVLERDA